MKTKTQKEMDEFIEYNRHFILYAKHWYKKENLYDDLKILLADYCGMLPEDLNSKDVYAKVNDVWETVTEEYLKDRFLFNLFEQPDGIRTDVVTVEQVIKKCCQI